MIKNIFDKASKWINSHNPRDIYWRQLLLAAGAILGLIIIILAIGFFIKNKDSTSQIKKKNDQLIKIELASNALDPEKIWRNHFEDKLMENDNSMNEQLHKISEKFHAESEIMKSQNKNDILELKDELLQAQRELHTAMQEMLEMKNSHIDSDDTESPTREQNITLQNISNEPNILMPKDSKFYIPETSYVSGFLLGGLAVSTSIGSSSEPVPVVIRITDRGNLPKNFNTDLSQCRILGSGYGDLSSQRAVIRAEVMICEDKDLEEVVTTKIAGLIYGDDGMNGIKGTIVDMSSKHIRSATIGGLLSGFSSTMKSEGDFVLGALGSVKTAPQKIEHKLRNNSFSGVSNAAEKIADYYIKQAENMSPILLIPGGTKLDVVFTKGVYIGSSDVVKKISNEMR